MSELEMTLNALWDEVGKVKRRLELLATQDLPSMRSGTSFPSQPDYGNNRPFYRTDLGWWCYYDGTRWLTCLEFNVQSQLVTGISADGNTYFAVLRNDYTPYITRVSSITYVAATNDGTKYWTLITQGLNAAAGLTSNIDSFTTAADTAAVYTAHDHAPSVTSTPANYAWLRMNYTKTSTPGNLQFMVTVYYRLVVT